MIAASEFGEPGKVELAALIDALCGPAAYPDAVGQVIVRQTHISAVFSCWPADGNHPCPDPSLHVREIDGDQDEDHNLL